MLFQLIRAKVDAEDEIESDTERENIGAGKPGLLFL